MKQTRDIMGMPISIEIADIHANQKSFDAVFNYFVLVDEKFSTYKSNSEISKINRDGIKLENYSDKMKEVFSLSEETKKLTNGFFDIKTPTGIYDPSGLVKGWAIKNASEILHALGHENFCIDAGGDIQTSGKNSEGKEWAVGIRNPFNEKEIIKIIYPKNMGVATSGTYIRGQHIYSPKTSRPVDTEILSLTVIGPNVYEADIYATSAFAMGDRGIEYIESLPKFEAYAINKKGIATVTSNFNSYTKI